MKSIAVLLALSSGLSLYGQPAGATDLVPPSDSPAKVQTKVPEGDTATTVTFKASSPSDASGAKTVEANDLFGEGNVFLPGAIDKSKPNALEILYGEVGKPLEPVAAGAALVPTWEFFNAAKKISVSITKNDEGKISAEGASIVYHVAQKGKETFAVYAIVSIPAVEKSELKTRLILNQNEWGVFGGSTRDAGDGTKRYFYWAIRINTGLYAFPPGTTDG